MAKRRVHFEGGHQRPVKGGHGYVLYNKNDTVIDRLIEVYGEYFETGVNVFRRVISAGNVALDSGTGS